MTPAAEQPMLAIWGASGHAMVVADIVRRERRYGIIGFLDDVNPGRRGSAFCGATILGGKEQLPQLLDKGVCCVLLAFGDCSMRLELTPFLEAAGFALPVAVHPRATVAEDVVLGPGTVIAAGAVVNAGTRIGKSVIVNTSASVDHECTVGDAAHIGPGAHLGGRVVIGQGALIGIGATIIDRIHVGAGCLVGAGAVVVESLPDRVVAYGVPARPRRMVDQ